VPLARAGQVLVPRRGAVATNGAFDVVVHFHGHEPVRKEWVRVMRREVLVGITLGVGSGVYEGAFRGPEALTDLLSEVERVVGEQTGRPDARVRRLALSAWSAGYGAVRALLGHAPDAARVDAVLLLDGLHCDYVGAGLDETAMAPFVRFARRAAGGERLMVVSHSSIVPGSYASTTETAGYLIDALGGRPRATQPRASDPLGLELLRRFDRRDLHVLGFSGNGRLDHCAHLGLMRDILKVHLAPRWAKKP
jgi:hypothetical protein